MVVIRICQALVRQSHGLLPCRRKPMKHPPDPADAARHAQAYRDLLRLRAENDSARNVNSSMVKPDATGIESADVVSEG